MALNYLDPSLFPYVGGGGYDPYQQVLSQVQQVQGMDPTGQSGYKAPDTAGNEYYTPEGGMIPITYGRYANEMERGWQPFLQSESTIDAANKAAIQQWFYRNARALVEENYTPDFSFINKLPEPYKDYATDQATKAWPGTVQKAMGDATPDDAGIMGSIAMAPWAALGGIGQSFSNMNVVEAGLNFASGGLYGTGKGLMSGDPWQMAAAGASPTSPGGLAQTNTQMRGPGSTLGAAAASGLAGGLSMLSSGPAVGPEGIPYLTDQAGYAGQQALIDPVTGGAMPGAMLTPSQLTAMAGGGLTAGSFAPAAGALGAAALGSLFGQPQPGPSGPAGGGAPVAGGTTPLSRPQQPAGGGAQEDTAHIGLARRFEDRIKGAREAPGLSSLQDIQRNFGYYMGR